MPHTYTCEDCKKKRTCTIGGCGGECYKRCSVCRRSDRLKKQTAPGINDLPEFALTFDSQGGIVITAPNGKQSEPVSYQSIVTIEYEGATYYACTQYYAGSLPVEQVFRLLPVKTELRSIEATHPLPEMKAKTETV